MYTYNNDHLGLMLLYSRPAGWACPRWARCLGCGTQNRSKLK